MNILQALFGAKSVVITSTMIFDKISRCERAIAELQVGVEGSMADIATMTDAQHIEAEAGTAASRRAIGRLDRRVAHLRVELPKVIATEEVAAKTASDELLRQRAESSRKANTKEARKLLDEYNKLASAIGDINARLAEIVGEASSVNAELHRNPVAEHVVFYDELHRKHPDQEASEHREMRDVWEHHDGTQTEAKRNDDGTLIRPSRTFDRAFGYYPDAKLERREVVIRRTSYRAGRYEASLSAICLPPGITGGAFHWPRQ